ncbi:hypothetical protein SCE1572_25965 [Sorangium cellulosum So0157-2]|uniref:Uncharacterized protein n=1 Tax=Sorangium cellulosum So0157-2 TaxID=1254432 RepID=S4XYR5_SORCE|nr:hypothetical protein SCE1572_25965 [Sorangium cellulosum So0157-2]
MESGARRTSATPSAVAAPTSVREAATSGHGAPSDESRARTFIAAKSAWARIIHRTPAVGCAARPSRSAARTIAEAPGGCAATAPCDDDDDVLTRRIAYHLAAAHAAARGDARRGAPWCARGSEALPSQ